MTCAETQQLLGASVDNELDLRAALDVQEHVAHCAACAAEEERLRLLQEAARAGLTRHGLPQGFETRLHAALLREEGPRLSAARRWRWALAPAAAAALVLVVAAPRVWAPAADAGVRDAVIAAHVRSLLANHLTDVASSDQHTVKPWFQGKLDYSVSVTDFASEGFPLVGGRLDYVEDTPAAALVYKRSQHVVNLFVWPDRSGKDEPPRHFTRRGYNLEYWVKDGMHCWVISDLNAADLRKFVELVRR